MERERRKKVLATVHNTVENMMFEEKIKAQIVFALAISDCGFQRFFCQEKRCESSYSLFAARKERDSDATMPRDRKTFLKLMQTQISRCLSAAKESVDEHAFNISKGCYVKEKTF